MDAGVGYFPVKRMNIPIDSCKGTDIGYDEDINADRASEFRLVSRMTHQINNLPTAA